MKQLPKKIDISVLDTHTNLDNFQLRNCVKKQKDLLNELIDYLGNQQDEKHKCVFKRINGGFIEKSNYCLTCHQPPKNSPDQQGECPCKGGARHCALCMEPAWAKSQGAEHIYPSIEHPDPPEQEEWEQRFRGMWYCVPKYQESPAGLEGYLNFIRDNFISKEKIKRVLSWENPLCGGSHEMSGYYYESCAACQYIISYLSTVKKGLNL